MSHGDFTTIINEEKNYPELKESIRMMKTQLKEIIWLRKVKENILIKLLEKKHKVKKMLSYCLKSRKNTKNIKRNIQGLVMVKQWYYQIVLYVPVDN